MRECWASGMDCRFPVRYPYISDWMKSVWSGDFRMFLGQLENKSGSEIQEMISRRETLFSVTPLTMVIIGARGGVAGFNPDGSPMKTDHIKIFDRLLSLGADVNVHDFAGYTPLHHCLTLVGNDLTLKMAEKLVKARANVNARNRFGATPLIEPLMGNKYEFVEFLLKNGADQTLKENEGYSAKLLANMNPKYQRLLVKYERKNTRAEKKELGQNPRCNNCAFGEGLKKCTGYYHVWYCGADCQKGKGDWESHKEECKKIKEEYKVCTYDKDRDLVTMTFVRVKQPSNKQKSHFVVKVQVTMTRMRQPDQEGPLSIYNKDRTFSVSILKENNDQVYDELFKNIVESGYHGLKGYFHVIFNADKPGKFKINSSRILPN